MYRISEQIEPPFALPYVSREQYMELLLLWRLHNGEEFTLGMLSMLRIIYDFYLEKYLNSEYRIAMQQVGKYDYF